MSLILVPPYISILIASDFPTRAAVPQEKAGYVRAKEILMLGKQMWKKKILVYIIG